MWRFPKMVVPQARWMIYFMENPHLKWMIWGYPHFGKPPCGFKQKIAKKSGIEQTKMVS